MIGGEFVGTMSDRVYLCQDVLSGATPDMIFATVLHHTATVPTQPGSGTGFPIGLTTRAHKPHLEMNKHPVSRFPTLASLSSARASNLAGRRGRIRTHFKEAVSQMPHSGYRHPLPRPGTPRARTVGCCACSPSVATA